MADALAKLGQLLNLKNSVDIMEDRKLQQKYREETQQRLLRQLDFEAQKFAVEQKELLKRQSFADQIKELSAVPENAPRDQYGFIDPRIQQQIMNRLRLGAMQSGYSGAADLVKDTKGFIEKPFDRYERTVDLGDRVLGVRADGEQDVWGKGTSPTSKEYGRQRQYSNVANLRKEFQATPVYKSKVIMDNQYSRAEAAMKQLNKDPKNNLAVDQTLITLFNKMLDENSVVRESEYARTPENLAFINRVKGKLAKMVEGGAGLTDSDRQAIYDMVTDFKTISDTRFEDEKSFYTDVARDHNFNPYHVTRVEPEYKRSAKQYSAEEFDEAISNGASSYEEALTWLEENK